MKVGYLHISVAGNKSGVTRYGRFLASAARKQSHLEILEIDVELTTNTTNNLKLLSTAAKKLSEADVIHIQFNKHTWGEKWQQFQNVKTFIKNCQVPLLATIHDVLPTNYPPYGLLEAFRREYYQQRNTNVGTRYQTIALFTISQVMCFSFKISMLLVFHLCTHSIFLDIKYS